MPHTVKHPDAPRIITVRTDIPENWAGFRFTPEGRYFVTPDGDRLTPERLRGLAWRDSMELRRAGFASRRKAEKAVRRQPVKVVVVDLADWHARNVGTMAG